MKEKKHHYTYVIINQKNGKMYIGVRSCNCEPMFDLGVKYFSSSLDKEFMKEQKEHPEKFSYQILSDFKTRKEASELEISLHKTHEVGLSDDFYNRCRATTSGFSMEGRQVSDEWRRKQSEAKTGKTHSKKAKMNMSKAQKGRIISKEHRAKIAISHKGKVISEEHKKKISEANLGRVKTKETREKLSIANEGKIISMETRMKISEANKGNTCSEENKIKFRELMVGKICVNNGEENKRIDKCDLEEYMERGYIKGMVKNEETHLRISESHKGKVLSEEHKKKISKATKGKYASDETKERMSIAARNRSSDTLAKIGDVHRGRIYVNNGMVNNKIKPEELDEYLRCGFVKGMKPRK